MLVGEAEGIKQGTALYNAVETKKHEILDEITNSQTPEEKEE
jgi:hypothetical protein